jgi:putative membrane protein insertion efficiency factor
MVHFLFTLPQRVLITLVRGYRLLLSPWLGSGCRFEPTCSAYSLQALEKHGAAVGTYMTLHRLARCHPFCEGGHDPVPDRAPALFRHFVTGAPRAAGSLSSTSIDKTSP